MPVRGPAWSSVDDENYPATSTSPQDPTGMGMIACRFMRGPVPSFVCSAVLGFSGIRGTARSAAIPSGRRRTWPSIWEVCSGPCYFDPEHDLLPAGIKREIPLR